MLAQMVGPAEEEGGTHFRDRKRMQVRGGGTAGGAAAERCCVPWGQRCLPGAPQPGRRDCRSCPPTSPTLHLLRRCRRRGPTGSKTCQMLRWSWG